ncbi:hypothetical protein EYF80_041280 [Liparis tanakae]|uniref:Uncharacterized protein n=1 Tax=Liparis tanakae TaxID=230148 RepID=A0A4Z2G4N1_9TELE|nr:hypothetical protein EYF80_041280 [Liparis tanakae]
MEHDIGTEEKKRGGQSHSHGRSLGAERSLWRWVVWFSTNAESGSVIRTGKPHQKPPTTQIHVFLFLTPLFSQCLYDQVLPLTQGQASGHGRSVIRGTVGGSCTPPIRLLLGGGRRPGVRWINRREGGSVREEGGGRQDLCLSGFWLQAACQLGLFPQTPTDIAAPLSNQ